PAGNLLLLARRFRDAHADRLCRQSPGARRFLDSAPHRGQSGWQVSMAVSLAGPFVGGLFLQRGAVIRLAVLELGGCQGALGAGGLAGRGLSCPPAGRALAPHGEAATVLP